MIFPLQCELRCSYLKFTFSLRYDSIAWKRTWNRNTRSAHQTDYMLGRTYTKNTKIRRKSEIINSDLIKIQHVVSIYRKKILKNQFKIKIYLLRLQLWPRECSKRTEATSDPLENAQFLHKIHKTRTATMSNAIHEFKSNRCQRTKNLYLLIGLIATGDN